MGFWSCFTKPAYCDAVALAEAKAIASANMYEAGLTVMREIIRARRSETPQSTPAAAVTYLINELEAAQNKTDRTASLCWELIAEFVPEAKLPRVRDRALSVLGERR